MLVMHIEFRCREPFRYSLDQLGAELQSLRHLVIHFNDDGQPMPERHSDGSTLDRPSLTSLEISNTIWFMI